VFGSGTKMAGNLLLPGLIIQAVPKATLFGELTDSMVYQSFPGYWINAINEEKQEGESKAWRAANRKNTSHNPANHIANLLADPEGKPEYVESLGKAGYKTCLEKFWESTSRPV
jgi:hypothetical protein